MRSDDLSDGSLKALLILLLLAANLFVAAVNHRAWPLVPEPATPLTSVDALKPPR